MKTVGVYKGMNSPLKIRGLYTKYFYMCFATLMLTGLLFAFTVSDALRSANGQSFIFEILIEMAIPAIVYKLLYSRSNHDKIVKKMKRVTVSNREIYKVLNRKLYKNE